MSLVSKYDEQIIIDYLRWVKRYRAPMSQKRVITSMTILRKISNEADRSLFELSPQEIEDYLFINYKNANTFNGYCADFKAFYKYYVDKGLVAQSPIIFKKARLPKALPKPITQPQQETLLRKVKNVKWHFAVELLLNTGIRRTEMIKLKLVDIDEADMVLRVRSRSQGGGGKGDKERLIPITPSLVNAYHNYLKEYRIQKKPNSWLFPGTKGGHMHEESLRHYLSKMKKQLRFKVNPHMLRHTFATNHINAGTDIRVLQELMGHERISTTQRYTKVNLVAMRKAQEKGTTLGEKDRLIAELTKKNQQIENLKRAVREQMETQQRIIDIVKSLEEQD